MSTNKGDDYLYTTRIKTDVQVTWLDLENCRRFPFHHTFENLETATNGTQKCPGKIAEKLLNFRDANHSTEISRNCGSKVEWKWDFRRKVSEKFVPREEFGICCTIRYWKLLKIHIRLFLVEWKSPCVYLLKNLVSINPLSQKYLMSLVSSVLWCKGYGSPALSENLYLVHNLQRGPWTSLDWVSERSTGKVCIPFKGPARKQKITIFHYLRSNLYCGSSDFSHSIEYKERGLVVRRTETISLSFLITSCVQQWAYSNMYSYHLAEFNLLQFENWPL